MSLRGAVVWPQLLAVSGMTWNSNQDKICSSAWGGQFFQPEGEPKRDISERLGGIESYVLCSPVRVCAAPVGVSVFSMVEDRLLCR